MTDRTTRVFARTVLAICCVLPTAAMASEVFACPELKAAVADAQRGFAAHKDALLAPASPAALPGKTYQTKKP